MKIHYMDCATMHPRGTGFFLPQTSRTPSLCLLIEAADQLILVDTGFGTQDMLNPRRLGHSDYLLNTQCSEDKPALRQIERMGFRATDVRHIICTHLDRDHAGGLSDFPSAKVHVTQAECKAALRPQNYKERDRYRRCHFEHGPQWVTHAGISDQPWFGMACMRDLQGLPPEIVLVPMPGHTRGHCGVAVDKGDGWLLHCGDAYYFKDEVRMDKSIPLAHKLFRRLAHCDYIGAMHQIDRIREVWGKNGDVLNIMASHDQFEYMDLFGRAVD